MWRVGWSVEYTLCLLTFKKTFYEKIDRQKDVETPLKREIIEKSSEEITDFDEVWTIFFFIKKGTNISRIQWLSLNRNENKFFSEHFTLLKYQWERNYFDLLQKRL